MKYRIKNIIISDKANEYYVQYKFLFWWFTVRGTYKSKFHKARFTLNNAKDHISRKTRLYKEEYIYPDKW